MVPKQKYTYRRQNTPNVSFHQWTARVRTPLVINVIFENHESIIRTKMYVCDNFRIAITLPFYFLRKGIMPICLFFREKADKESKLR